MTSLCLLLQWLFKWRQIQNRRQTGLHFYFIRIISCQPEVYNQDFLRILTHVTFLVFRVSRPAHLWHHISNMIIVKLKMTFTEELQYNRNVGNHFTCLFHLSGWTTFFFFFVRIVEFLLNGLQFARIDIVRVCCIFSICRKYWFLFSALLLFSFGDCSSQSFWGEEMCPK